MSTPFIRARGRGLWFVLTLSACGGSANPADGGLGDGGLGDGGNGTPGAACSTAADCDSHFCLGGFCCAQACQFDPNHPECAVCDPAGACQYPSVACEPASGCAPGSDQYVGAALCGQGTCGSPQLQACGPYQCSPTGCQTSCSDDTSCASGFFCRLDPAIAAGLVSLVDGGGAGTCEPQSTGGGFCSHADECASKVCLKNVCCAQACTVDSANPECTSCDPASGACLYPDVVCRGGGCDEANDFSPPSQCQQGTCPLAAPVACNSYLCTTQGCALECLTDADCASSAFCLYPNEGVPNQVASLQQGNCCPRFEPGKPIYVDVATGNDAVCCGFDAQHPCQTVFRITTLWNSFLQTPDRAASTLTLELRVDGGPGSWVLPAQYANAGSEQWTNGMIVHAPGVSFPNGITVSSTLSVWGPYSIIRGDGTGFTGQTAIGLVPGTQAPLSPATIKGDPGAPVYAQITVGADVYPLPPPAVVNLANVVGGGTVQANGEAHIGQDDQGKFGSVSGNFQVIGDRFASTVCEHYVWPGPAVDNNNGVGNWYGISYPECHTPGWEAAHMQCVPAILTDWGSQASDAGAFFGGSIFAGDCAQVDLSNAPLIGPANGVSVPDAGLMAIQSGVIHLANGSIQGTGYAGVYTTAAGPVCPCLDYVDVHVNYAYGCTQICAPDGGGLPAIELENTSVTGNGCFGLLSQHGTIFADQTTVTGNYLGVVQDYLYDPKTLTEVSGRVDLAHLPDGGATHGNEVFCNSAAFANATCPNRAWHQPGVDAWNLAPGPLSADGVAWSQFPPTKWVCDADVTQAGCSDAQGHHPDGGDLVLVQSPDAFNTPAGPITYSNPTLVSGASCP